MPGSFGKELVRQGAGIVKSGSAPTSGNTGSGKSGIRKTDPVKNGQAAGRKIVKSAAGKAAGKIIGTKAVAGAVGALRDIISTRQKSRKLPKKNGRRLTKTGLESGVMTQGLNSLT